VGNEAFDDAYFTRLRAASGHWWVQGMREVGASVLGPVEAPAVVLDAGCGTGTNLPWLASLGGRNRVYGLDASVAALAQCRRAGVAADLLQASASALPFPDATFDLLVSLDVLQHLTEGDAVRAVAEARRVLRPGGRILVRTNAAFGRRRVPQRADWRLYTRSGLARALTAAGLVVERLTAANALLGVWSSLRRPTRSRAVGTPHGLGIPQPVPARRNRLLLELLRAEARWLARPGRHLSVGHSLYAVARRPLIEDDSVGRTA
jgi:SAM-dependent methyltransferase